MIRRRNDGFTAFHARCESRPTVTLRTAAGFLEKGPLGQISLSLGALLESTFATLASLVKVERCWTQNSTIADLHGKGATGPSNSANEHPVPPFFRVR
jgi:hypothetical protein